MGTPTFDYYIELFRHNFVEGRGKIGKTAFYGLGRQTEEILRAFPSFPVIGLLDGYREEGEIYGKEIISLSSLAGQDVKIIILARKASEKIIYNRIRRFCKEQEISVYSIDGRLLGEEENQDTGEEADQEYFRRNRKELMDRISQCDTVSFDIFDTLLTRCVLQPEQIFRIVGTRNGMAPGFADMRIRAELELSREGPPRISDIYHWLEERMDIPPDKLMRLIDDEIVVERLMLRPRQTMVEVFQDTVSLGKNVYLISDMYLPGSVLEKILHEKGIEGYDGLFVSCDWGTDKTDGLYDVYKNRSRGGKRLHIGDSEEEDGKAAIAHGIETYLIKRPQDIAELSPIGRGLMRMDGAAEWQGMICASLFNNPFALYGCRGKLHLSPAGLGYGALGPILAGYVHWLFCKLLEEEPDIMLFIARDGFLVKEIYDLWKEKKGVEGLPQGAYLMTSRTFSVYASIQDRADILYAAGLPFDGSAEEMLCKRFHLEKKDILPRGCDEKDVHYIMRHSVCILSQAAVARGGYQEYLSRFGLGQKKVGIFDFVSTGTCQMCLEKILGISMKGYYFERIMDSHTRKRGLVIEDFVHTHEPHYESSNYFLLESWIKALHPSIDYVFPDGSVIYCEQHKSREQQDYVRQIQKGALEFCKDYLKLAESTGEGDMERLAVSLLPFVNEDSVCMDSTQLTVYDDFSSREIKI